MTIDDLQKIDRDWLLAREVAEILKCDPHTVRVWARQRPETIGFPVSVVGSRVRIPKSGFLKFMGVFDAE